MAAKTSNARRGAFFKALAETGNQTISAERAGVSRSWVVQRQAADPEFRAEMDACIAAANARLLDGRGNAGQDLGFDQDGVELVMRGCHGRLNQIARTRVGQWTPRLEARFLGIIGKSCNVAAACRMVGVSAASAYYRRISWPRFAERWDEAIALGTVQLEFALVENACNFLVGVEPDYDAPMADMTTDHAIQILSIYNRSSDADRRHRNWRYRRRSYDEVRASILRKIEAIERHREREDGWRQQADELGAYLGLAY
jgi:hypothetical protein